MRIIGGEKKGRRLVSFRGRDIRPTTDRIREAIFDTLSSKDFRFLDSKAVLDLFAGTGALGIEAMSRGVGRGIFVDIDSRALKVIERNLDLCDLTERSELFHADVFLSLSRLRRKGMVFDLIFADPPYEKGLAMRTIAMVAKKGLLAADGWMVVEHSRREPVAQEVSGLICVDNKLYGDTRVSYYRCEG